MPVCLYDQNKMSHGRKIKKEIESLELKYEENIDPIQNKNLELQNIRAHKLSGSFIRSRVKWIEFGEKPSSYFCHLESRNYTSKIIPRIIDNNDE